MKCKALKGANIGVGSITKEGLTTDAGSWTLPPSGDCIACFMPLNCTEPKEQCAIVLRYGKDLLWKMGKTAWGTKPKKIPVRKLLKEIDAKSAPGLVGLRTSTVGQQQIPATAKVLHREVRVLPVEHGPLDETTFHAKLQHMIRIKDPIVISIYRITDGDVGRNIRTSTFSASLFRLDLFNARDQTRSEVRLPGSFDGTRGFRSLLNAITISFGGDTIYIKETRDTEVEFSRTGLRIGGNVVSD